MSELPYNQLKEHPPKQELPAQHGYPQQQGTPVQMGYPPAYSVNQQMGVVPTTTVIGRDGQVQPSDYLALSIIVMICCCLPLGIVALIKSQEVGTRFRAGDYDGALESSKAAKSYAMGGLYCGLAVHVMWIAFVIVYVIIVVVEVNKAVQEGDIDYNSFHFG